MTQKLSKRFFWVPIDTKEDRGNCFSSVKIPKSEGLGGLIRDVSIPYC